MYETPRSSFLSYQNSRDTVCNETIHHSPSCRRRIIERSTAPFVITRTGAECRRRDANISDARAILSRTSRFRVFLEKLCNDARRFTPGRTWFRIYASLHESDRIDSPRIHRSIGYKECRYRQGRCHCEVTLHC